jgi:hypothetical protein
VLQELQAQQVQILQFQAQLDPQVLMVPMVPMDQLDQLEQLLT